MTVTFIIPSKPNYNGKYQIKASGGRCAACDVRWTYEMGKAEVPDIIPLDLEDLDKEKLRTYFDLPSEERPDTKGTKKNYLGSGIISKIKGLCDLNGEFN